MKTFPPVSCFMFVIHVWPPLLHLSCELLHVDVVLIFNIIRCMFDLRCCMLYVTFLYVNFMLHVWPHLLHVLHGLFVLNKTKNKNFPTYFMFHVRVRCLTSVVVSFTWTVAYWHGSHVLPHTFHFWPQVLHILRDFLHVNFILHVWPHLLHVSHGLLRILKKEKKWKFSRPFHVSRPCCMFDLRCCIFYMNYCMLTWFSCLTSYVAYLTSSVVCFTWPFYI